MSDRLGERMLVVRSGTASDFESAADLWHDAVVARAGTDPIPDGQRERVRAWANDPAAFLVVVCDVDATVGMTVGLQAIDVESGATIDGLCHLTTVAVAPDRWGEGIGHLVIEAALDEARARGYARAQLWTYATNARAIALYEREGFTRTDRTQITSTGVLNLHFERDL